MARCRRVVSVSLAKSVGKRFLCEYVAKTSTAWRSIFSQHLRGTASHREINQQSISIVNIDKRLCLLFRRLPVAEALLRAASEDRARRNKLNVPRA